MEDEIYWAVAVAALIGIVLVAYDISTSEKPYDEFTELYFRYERKALENDGDLLKTTLYGTSIYVNVNEVWIDFNGNLKEEEGEEYYIGDSFTLAQMDWNIADLTEKEILFGAYPKEKMTGSLDFSCVIVNHLGKNHSYGYVIAIDGAEVDGGSVDVASEEKKLLTFSVEIKEKGRHKVSIRLDTGEEIYFWVSIN